MKWFRSMAADPSRRGLGRAWGLIAVLAALAAYLFAFSEWLFQVTRPSFLSPLSWSERLGVLGLSGLALAGAGLLLLPLPALLSLAAGHGRLRRLCLWAGALVPGAFLASAGLLLVDNFTYTLFRVGVVTATGPLRAVYALLFLLLLAWGAARVVRAARDRRRAGPRLRLGAYACAAVLALSLPFGGSLYLERGPGGALLPDTGQPRARPNILLIGSDGVNAARLSAYGYREDTSPFLRALAGEALLSENNFPNANLTSGSLVSMFTGRLPTSTRMLFPPDTLRGAGAFRHLPGILKQEGYTSVQLSVDYYGDAESANLLDGFYSVNGRAAASGLYALARERLPDESAYFLSFTAQRLGERLAHSFYLRAMPNPYAQVTGGLDSSSDPERLEQLFALFRQDPGPWFAHVHLMGTHQYLYEDYDEALRRFDRDLQVVFAELQRLDLLEHTLVIVYSDHGRDNALRTRTPLLFRFPGGEHAGRLRNNTQNLDIAPTVLDYLGLEQPGWMAGRSLLRGEPPAGRPIFSAAPNYRRDNDQGRLELDLSKIGPPFYQFGTLDVIVCHRWYALDTTTRTWSSGRVEGHTAPCGPEELPGMEGAKELLGEQLRRDGFEVEGF